MGAVLAMKRGSKLLIALVLAASVSACSNQKVANPMHDVLRDSASVVYGTVRPSDDAPVELTRARIANIRAPLIRIERSDTGGWGLALPFVRNQDAQTWQTGAGFAFVIKEGVLFATRGLGWDLLAAETDATMRAVRAGGMDRYARSMRYIAGDESLRVERYFCEMHNDGPTDRVVLEVRHSTRRMRENCYAIEGNQEFRNIYWIGSDGTIWDSRQWVSPQIGYVSIQRLVR